MNTLRLEIPTKLHRQLKKLSRQQQRVVNQAVKHALEESLRNQELRKLQDSLSPLAERAGFYSEQDIFDAVS